MNDGELPASTVAALRHEVEELRRELAEARRALAAREEASRAAELGQARELAASAARAAIAGVDEHEAWKRAAELGVALGRRIAEGQARLIASQAAVATLESANAGLASLRTAAALREGDLRAVIESAIDCAIVTTDPDGLVLAWNPGARDLLGWDEAAALAMDLGAALAPDDAAERAALAGDGAAALGGGRVSREGWLWRRDGRRVWVTIEAMPLRAGDDAEPIGVLWMLRDRSAALQARESLRLREQRLRGVLDGMTEGFGLIGPDFTILEHNPEALRMDGRPREEIVGRSHWDAYPGTKGSELGRLLEHAMTAREPVSLEHCYAFADGTTRWLDMRAYPTTDGALAVFWRDVTDRKNAEAALRESEGKYRTLFEAMDEGYCIIEVLFDGDDRPVDYRFVEVNAAFERQTGLRDAAGRRMRELVPEHDDHWFGIYGRIARGGVPERFKSEAVALGRWFDVFAFRVGPPDARRVAVLFNDITAHKQAEAALHAAEARQAFLLRLSDAMRGIADPVDTQRVAMRLLGEFLGADRAFYYHAERTAQGWVHVVDHDFGWQPGLPARIGRRAPAEFGAHLFGGLERGEPVAVGDVRDLPDLTPTERANYEAAALRSFIVAPLMKGGRYVGGVSTWSAVPRRWSVEDVALVTEVAERSWAAAERARAIAALRASEERFRGFAEHSADVLWIVSGDGNRLEYLSPAFDRVFGEPREAVMADFGRFLDLVHPEDRDTVTGFLPRALAGETAVAHYRVIRPADGRIVHLRDTGFPIRDSMGAVARVAGIVQDVTDTVGATAALEREKERLRTLAEGIPQLVWRAGPRGDWTWASPQWTAFTGLSDEASRGDGWLQAVHPEDRAGALAAWDAAGATGRFEVVCRLRRASDGAWRWFQASSLRGPADGGGGEVEWFGTCTDIDDVVRAREMLARGAEELEARVAERTAELMAAEASLRQAQKMEAIGQLTGGIAHDFNNMLQGVTGALDMGRRRLEEGRTDDAGRYMLAARDAAGRAAGLTRRLLAFARRQRLEPSPVRPEALVTSMAEMLRRTVGPSITLELRLREGAGAVMCDPNELEGALLNLCINARDAMPDGGSLTLATRDVRIAPGELQPDEAARPGPFVEIAVTDTGEGMPPEVLERVLEPFFTTKPPGQGTGLGLSQVYGFVRQSGGLLRIASTVGRGTTVRLLLPHSEGAEGAGAAASGEARPGELTPPPGRTVLLVDDEDAVRGPAAARLRDLGYRVAEASDGPAALRLLEDGLRPDLLVTDVGLPGRMDGRSVAEAAQRRVPGLPALFITGFARVPLPEGAAVIAKPFDLDMLARSVGAALTRGR